MFRCCLKAEISNLIIILLYNYFSEIKKIKIKQGLFENQTLKNRFTSKININFCNESL